MLRTVTLVLSAVFLSACAHSGSRLGQAFRSVNELMEIAEDGTPTDAFPQYWKRSTLVIDMQGAASAGKFNLKPREGHQWPMRVAFRLTPGKIKVIEVHADQRLLIPVTREGTKAVDIELVPGVYTTQTEQMTVQWGQ